MTRWLYSVGPYHPPSATNRINPLSSMYFTMSPISSICAASITLNAPPRLIAIRLPIGSSWISSTCPFSSFFMTEKTLLSLPDTPCALDNFFNSSLTMSITHYFFYPAKSPVYVFTGGCITKAGILWCIAPKCCTGDNDNTLLYDFLGKHRFHRDKSIKCTFRNGKFKTQIPKPFEDHVPSLTVFIPHHFYRALIAGVRCKSCILGNC